MLEFTALIIQELSNFYGVQKTILRAHGYNISHGGQPVLHKPKKIGEKVKERFRAKMDRVPTLQETLGRGLCILQ